MVSNCQIINVINIFFIMTYSTFIYYNIFFSLYPDSVGSQCANGDGWPGNSWILRRNRFVRTSSISGRDRPATGQRYVGSFTHYSRKQWNIVMLHSRKISQLAIVGHSGRLYSYTVFNMHVPHPRNTTMVYK